MSQSEINAAWEEGFTFGYNQGDLEGYERGHEDGYHKGMQEKAISTQGYDDGYDIGYCEGYNKAYFKGDLDGYARGYNEGKQSTSKENTQVSDNTFKSVFPKHLKTDKEFLKKLQKSKEDCITHIDFEKIHSVMKHLDWKWFTDNDVSVPSIVELVLFAQKQINTAVQGFLENDCNEYFASSGGFKASVKGFSDGFCSVTLEFIVSDWDSEIGGEK